MAMPCRPLFGGNERPSDYINKVTKSGGYNLLTCHRVHYLDYSLGAALAQLLNPTKPKTLIDFGAGCGCYASLLQYLGFQVTALDGTPKISSLTNGLVQEADFVKSLDHLHVADWVMSMEVGEHIPAQFETAFLQNLVGHAKEGVILSWAHRGQGGQDHINELQDWEVMKRMMAIGWVRDEYMTADLRKSTHHVAGCCTWLEKNLQVFRRNGTLFERCAA